MLHELRTWGELGMVILSMSADQRAQEIQIIPPTDEKPIELHPVYAVGTLKEFECGSTRSTFDNKHHPESIALLSDYNFFDEDGSIGENLMTGERIFLPESP